MEMTLTNGSRQMVHGEWVGARLRVKIKVRVGEPFVVNYFVVNQLSLKVLSVNVLSWNRMANVEYCSRLHIKML